MATSLIIVESPTKAQTLARFLGDKYQIEASYGHVRDLPKAEFGVDVYHDFQPRYVIPTDKKKRVNELKKTAAKYKKVILATDPDREGEAIAWHIMELLSNSKFKIKDEKRQVSEQVKVFDRIVFHEITPEAVKEALENPRDIDLKLVDAQQARRILDRLVGYKLSPLLWQKIRKGLSAGRVQSVAVRLIVEREREIQAFKTQEYWTIEAELESGMRQNLQSAGLKNDENRFKALLIAYNNRKVSIKNEGQAKQIVADLKGVIYRVDKITQKETKRYPLPPFTTSTLQQTAVNRLGFSTKKTMQLAQGLYEQGLITYIRTDSVNLSESAIAQTRKYITEKFGSPFLPKIVRHYRVKSKVAQEAHEAIRPTKTSLLYEDLAHLPSLTRDHVRLYDLIWKRMMACQMAEAVLDQTTIDINADTYSFRTTGSVVKFEGWMKVYEENPKSKIQNPKSDDETREVLDDRGRLLPKLNEKEVLNLIQLLPEQHFTEPPARYTEASLIKILEEKGIGRPSTYAPIISTIQERRYVEKEDRKLLPTPLGFAVNDFLVENFADVVDYSFTAEMEGGLDEVAQGEREWVPMIAEFWTPFNKKLSEVEKEAERVKVEVEETEEKCPQCGKNLVIRIGRFGKFLACSGFPECKYTKSYSTETNIKCPQCGSDVVIKKTKRGKTFYGCSNYPKCKFASWSKPKLAKTS